MFLLFTCYKLFLLNVAGPCFKTCIVMMCLKTISLAYRPFGYFELDPLSLFEPFLWTLVSGQGANKAVLYLESD